MKAKAKIHPRGVQLFDCVGVGYVNECPWRDIRPSGSRPSCCKDCSMLFQTRGFGSCMGKSNLACSAMYLRSRTSSEQAVHDLKCPSCSSFPPLSIMYGSSSWNCWQVIFFFILSPTAQNAPVKWSFWVAGPAALSVAGGLFGSAELQQVAQLHARLMQ